MTATKSPRPLSRRQVLAGAAALAVPAAARAGQEKRRRPKIAAITTEYRTNSHADVLITKFLSGCDYPGAEFQPQVEIASLYLDQTPANDIGHALAREHNVPIYPTIRETLCLGGKELAVDGVLIVGEHGDYPYNERQQHLYPRRRLFEETVGVIRPAVEKGRPAPPVFSDKHLSTYNWDDAKWMVKTARELKIPFMAGSSLPLTWRRPPLVYPIGVELTEALATGYGWLDAYGFHALEMLQCMVERRKGAETGVRAIQCVKGEAVWKAAEPGAGQRWSLPLLDAAMRCGEHVKAGDVQKNAKEPVAVLIEYRDGLRGTMLMLDPHVGEFLFAAQRTGEKEPDASLFWLQEPKPFAHFARLAAAIEKMFLSRKPTYPVERTLLTTGILLFAHDSLCGGEKRIETPDLAIRYRPPV